MKRVRIADCGLRIGYRRALLVALVTSLPATLPAQRPAGTMPVQRSAGWTVVRTAKWTLLAGAVGLGAYALHHSLIAERSYGQLRELCIATPARCQVDGGTYVDAGAEALFARSVAADKHAQVGIFGGQVALLGSVGLFIYDLRNGHGPRDIPYPAKSSVKMGMRIPF
jgi:hypothetical protein